MTIFRQKIKVVFPQGTRGYRVTRTRNITVYYSKSESGAVKRALKLLSAGRAVS